LPSQALQHRDSLRVLAAIALAVLLSASAIGCEFGDERSREEPGPRHPTSFGFNEDTHMRSYDLQADLAMPIRRFPVAWSDVEPAPGRWVWGRYDSDYRSMREEGLSPLIVAIGAPCWAAPARTACEAGLRGPPDPSHDADWAEYVRRLTARYPDAAGIEVWNEPNIGPYFSPGPDPVRYTALLKAAYRAVKRVDPKMRVISGGLFASSASGGFAISDEQFLAGMYGAGARGYMDGIGAHPYPTTQGGAGGNYDIEATEDAIDRLRSIRDAAGDTGIRIWITEMGISTASAPGFPPGESESGQAQELLGLVKFVRNDGHIPVALIHRLIDAPPNPSGGALGLVESGFGVFRADGVPKSSACALSDAFGGSLSC
jgi:hypothetical protein